MELASQRAQKVLFTCVLYTKSASKSEKSTFQTLFDLKNFEHVPAAPTHP